jgi:hypothetical protein
VWQSQDGGEMTIDQARRYTEQFVPGGHDDWRLPPFRRIVRNAPGILIPERAL